MSRDLNKMKKQTMQMSKGRPSRRNSKISVTETGWAFMFKEGMSKERLVGNELREVN